MATEDDLRSSMQSGGGRGRIDVDAVIRRSRGRRRTKELLLGGATTLALLGFVVPATLGVLGPGMTTAGGSAESADAPVTDEEIVPLTIPESGADDDGPQNMPVHCTAPTAPLPSDLSSSDLVLTLDFPDVASIDTARVTGTATLTNASDEPISAATTAIAPWVTISEDGVVVGTTGLMEDAALVIDLDPGESETLPAWIETNGCAPRQTDYSASSLPPGDYDVIGQLQVDFGDEGRVDDVVTSATTTITLE